MKSDNELIAEFMGFRYGKNADSNGYLRYATSWDWLMPVVQKIDQLWMGCGGAGELGEMCDRVILMHICDRIDRVYQAVVKFIKWYNTQPS